MVCLTYSFNAQQKIVVSQPEYRVLYTQYDNKIECLSNVSDSVYITTKNPSDAKVLFVKEGIDSKGYFVVRPLIYDSLTLEFHAVKEGKDEIIDTQQFTVMMFPTPEIQNSYISKSSVTEIEVAYPMFFPIKEEFIVIGGRVIIKDTEYPYTGNRVPGSLFSKVKSGSKVLIEVIVKRKGQASPDAIKSVIPVTD